MEYVNNVIWFVGLAPAPAPNLALTKLLNE